MFSSDKFIIQNLLNVYMVYTQIKQVLIIAFSLAFQPKYQQQLLRTSFNYLHLTNYETVAGTTGKQTFHHLPRFQDWSGSSLAKKVQGYFLLIWGEEKKQSTCAESNTIFWSLVVISRKRVVTVSGIKSLDCEKAVTTEPITSQMLNTELNGVSQKSYNPSKQQTKRQKSNKNAVP